MPQLALLPLFAALAGTTAAPLPPAAHPGFMEAARLVQMCSADPSEQPDAGPICLGYIVGAVDQLLIPGGEGDTAACFPAEISGEQLVATVLAYGPLALDSDGTAAADYLRYVFADAFPCADAIAAP